MHGAMENRTDSHERYQNDNHARRSSPISVASCSTSVVTTATDSNVNLSNSTTSLPLAPIPPPPPPLPAARLFPSYRLTVSFMCFLLLFEMFILRVNISMALVCMVKSTKKNPAAAVPPTWNCSGSVDVGADSNCTAQGFNPVSEPAATTGSVLDRTTILDHVHQNLSTTTNGTRSFKGEFEWSKRLQGFILSAYFWGYITTQAVGGWLGGRYGGKHVAGTGLLVSVVTTVLLPSAARFSPYCVIVLRVILGAASGVLLSNVQTLLGIWAPPLERTWLSALAYNGMTVGTMVALLISSVFCTLAVDNGWPFAFYSTGIAGFVFWVAWNLIVYDSPSVHPRISQNELQYINHCTQQNQSGSNNGKLTRRPFPWLKALTCPAVIAILTAHTSSTWLLYTNITMFPMYMKDVLKFDIKQNGIYLMLPHIPVLIGIVPFSYFTDFIRRRKILSTVAVRKVNQMTASVVCGILLIGQSFVDVETRYAAVGITIAVAIFQNILCRAGYLVNPQDIAPSYSGEVFGISNTFATLSGIISPVVCAALTPNGTADEWRIVFYIAAAVIVSGGTVFSIFAQGEVVDWAKLHEEPKATSLNNSSGTCVNNGFALEHDSQNENTSKQSTV